MEIKRLDGDVAERLKRATAKVKGCIMITGKMVRRRERERQREREGEGEGEREKERERDQRWVRVRARYTESSVVPYYIRLCQLLARA